MACLWLLVFIVVSANASESASRPTNQNVPKCLRDGSCKFWGSQFDCTMCPCKEAKPEITDNDEVKITKDFCVKEKSEIKYHVESKRLMVMELKTALNAMISKSLLNLQQKSLILEKLGMDADTVAVKQNVNLPAKIFESTNDISRLTPLNDKVKHSIDNSSAAYPIRFHHPANSDYGDDLRVHLRLLQRKKRLKLKQIDDFNRGGFITVLLREDLVYHRSKRERRKYRMEKKRNRKRQRRL